MKVLLTATVQSHIAQFHKPLMKMLKRHGCEVHVAARNNLAEKNGLQIEYADKIYDIPFARSPKSPDNIKAYRELKKLINDNGYDIVHCNTPMGGIITRLAAKKARKSGTKVFYTAHGFHFYEGAPKKNWLVFYPIEKYFAEHLTDKLITITKEDYRLASDRFKTEVAYIHGVGVNEEKYMTVTDEANTKFKKESGFTNRFVVLCTGELNKNKNQALLIDAISIVAKDHEEVLLLLAGNGKEENNLREQIKKLGLEKNVMLLGYRTDLEKYVHACDLVASVSLREGLPLNIMEAMICAKTAVVSDNRGHRELIKNNVTGIVVNPLTAENIAEEIEILMKEAEPRKKYEQAANESSKPYLTVNVTEELREIYEL